MLSNERRALALAPSRGELATKLQARYAADFVIDSVVPGTGGNTYYVRSKYDEHERRSVPVHVSRIKRYRDPMSTDGIMPWAKIQDESEATIEPALAEAEKQLY